jgi:methanogenic corrinoid protein MtbC1
MSPRDLGAAIGVSESSVKRWADDGELTLVRTRGGHRRIRVADAVRFIRKHAHHVVRPELLGLPPRSRQLAQLSTDAHSTLLAQFLEDGRFDAARSALVHAFMEGVELATLARDVLQPALAHLGELWHHGPEGIAIEHAATETCLEAMHEIERLLPEPGDRVALGGAPEWDPYQLPTLVVSLTLRVAGWRTVNLGPRVPLDAYTSAVDKFEPKIVWLSVSSTKHDSDAAEYVREMARRLAPRRIRIVVGGRSSGQLAAPEADFAHDRLVVTDSLAKLELLARTARTGRRSG